MKLDKQSINACPEALKVFKVIYVLVLCSKT